MNRKPIIGITLGDPAGIGSEITAKMLTNENIEEKCIPVIIGDAKVVKQGFGIIGSDKELTVLDAKLGDDILDNLESGKVYVYDLNNIELEDYTFGKISAKAGKASGEFIENAARLAINGKIDAIVTNAIHKESFTLGGYGEKYAGHTEMLSDLTNTKKYAMMLACGNLRILHVTTHVSLKDAIEKLITKERVTDVVKIANDTCHQLGINKPKIGVAGLNPHSGENGLFGDEEGRIISPGIEEAKQLGINVEGPVPPDTLFCKAKGGMYDACVAMYHDQGHIPAKLAGFIYDEKNDSWTMRGVNITLGLPIIRASVDHGVAFGKAGKGKADYQSLLEALNYAVKMANVKRQHQKQNETQE